MKNSIFSNYARYYNLLYKDKDYAAEAYFVHELIQSHCPGARTVLNLGCGTGNHDFELAKLGYEITGIDMSAEMLSSARHRLASSETVLPPAFIEGDIRTVRLERKFDIVISLFHVMSYQITNEDIRNAIDTAKEHLADGGLFIFDCWYGPAVLSDPPVVRIKRFEDEAIQVVRIAEPAMYPNENIVDIHYQVMISEKSTGRLESLMETHRMRYLFKPEMTAVFRDAGFIGLDCAEWLTGQTPDKSTWYVYFVCRL